MSVKTGSLFPLFSLCVSRTGSLGIRWRQGVFKIFNHLGGSHG